MAAIGTISANPMPVATLSQSPFHGASLASIQNMFHFDTNNFLKPMEGECPPLDYAELFSILNDSTVQASAGSSGGLSAQPAGSGGGVVSQCAPLATTSQQPNGSLWQQQTGVLPGKLPEAKNARDNTSKRGRDNGNSKNKQQQVKELEALAAKKLEDLERLTRENSELKFRKHILEKVVKLRDHQLKVIRGGDELQPVCFPFPGALSGASPSSSPSCSGGEAAAAAWQPGNGSSAAVAIRTVSCGSLLAGPAGAAMPAAEREKFRCLGKSQLMDAWRNFLSEVAVPLLAVEANPEDETAAAQMLQLATQATWFFKHSCLLAPDTVMLVSQTHLESELVSPPEPSHWHNVVRTLELTPEQTTELRAVFQLFGDIMRGVLAERRAINSHLATSNHPVVTDMSALMEQLTLSPECEVLQNLMRSMRREKAAHMLLRGYLFGSTLTVLQFVKAAVYSYPWMADATAIVGTMAELASRQQQQ